MQSKSFGFLFIIICERFVAHVVTAKNFDRISSYSCNFRLSSLLPGTREWSLDFICGDNSIDEYDRFGYYKRRRIMSCQKSISEVKILSFKNCTSSVIETVVTDEEYEGVDYPNVNSFDVSGNDLETLPQHIANNSESLVMLIASENRLTEITANYFSNNKFLRYVNLSYNSIQHVDPMAFGDSNVVAQLNLQNNRIDHLNDHWLRVPSLIALVLSNNNLSTIGDRAFEEFTNLIYLDLSYNPIQLKIVTFAHLNKLTHLFLRGTKLSIIQMGTFSHQHMLVSLDLSENNLKALDFNLFLPALHDLWSLNLAGNQLTDLDGFRNAIFPSLHSLDIKNNHFNCSYLQRFISTVNWEKLRLYVNPKSTNIYEPNIRGVNCIETDDSGEFLPKANAMEPSNDVAQGIIKVEAILSEMNAKFIGTSFINVTQGLICITVLCFLVVYIVLHRKRRLINTVNNRGIASLATLPVSYKNNRNDELLLL